MDIGASAVALLACVGIAPVLAQSMTSVAQKDFARCFETVGASSGIHPPLLRAIAQVESSNNPGATNKQHLGRTGSYDIGLMQINSRWLPTLKAFGIGERDLFEPCTSIEVGAWILSDLFRRHGSGWEAVGAYNAACSSLKGQACRKARDSYITKVRRALHGTGADSGATEVMATGAVADSSPIEPLIQSIEFSN